MTQEPGRRFIVRTVSGFPINAQHSRTSGNQPEGVSAMVLDRALEGRMDAEIATYRSEDRVVPPASYRGSGKHVKRGTPATIAIAEAHAARLNRKHGPWPVLGSPARDAGAA
jgi:hypothetical protein